MGLFFFFFFPSIVKGPCVCPQEFPPETGTTVWASLFYFFQIILESVGLWSGVCVGGCPELCAGEREGCGNPSQLHLGEFSRPVGRRSRIVGQETWSLGLVTKLLSWISSSTFLGFTFAWGFPGASVVKNLPAIEGDTGGTDSVSGSGRSPGGGNGNPLQYSCLENPSRL